MRRAAGRTPVAPTMPSRSSTWSRTRAAAKANDTTAASRTHSPVATSARRIPRNGHRPAFRRVGCPADCASTSKETTKPVVVGGDPRGLAIIVAQRQAQSAQLRCPGGRELAAEPMPAGPDDAKHAQKLPDLQQTWAVNGKPARPRRKGAPGILGF